MKRSARMHHKRGNLNRQPIYDQSSDDAGAAALEKRLPKLRLGLRGFQVRSRYTAQSLTPPQKPQLRANTTSRAICATSQPHRPATKSTSSRAPPFLPDARLRVVQKRPSLDSSRRAMHCRAGRPGVAPFLHRAATQDPLARRNHGSMRPIFHEAHASHALPHNRGLYVLEACSNIGIPLRHWNSAGCDYSRSHLHGCA